ncbi:MAG: glycosyltransferase family 2 protein [Planctomycetota bacterium]|jgi:GT2 family glycosyltransferase
MTTGGASAAPRVSIVVLSWNTRDLLAACLASLRDVADELPFETIVVDNGSEDDSAEMVARDFPEAHLVRNAANEGYAQGNNGGAVLARGEYLLLLNSDTEVRAGALGTLAAFLDEHKGHGACAPRLDNPDGTPQPSCKTFPTLMTAVFYDTFFERWFPNNKTLPRYLMSDFDHTTSRDVDQPPGAALMIRRELWEKLGGFDPELWLFFNDVDLCRRIREAGYDLAYVAEARVLHHEGKSTEQLPEFGAIWHKNRLSYYRKTYGWRGVAVARLMSTLRGWEEARKLRRAGAPKEERAAVWSAVREVWAA